MILYKYFPCNEYTFKSLAVKGLWCHTYENMNDPFECLNVLERTFSSLELETFRAIVLNGKHQRWQNLAQKNDNELTHIINTFRKEILHQYAFCSLSEDPNEILMWSHYANSHNGIVIGFEFSELENNHHLQKVDYEENLNEINLEKYAHYLIGDTDDFIDELFKDYSIKSSHWGYEKEWRIWRKTPSYYYFKPEHVKEVCFGLNTSFETKAVIIELMNYLPDSVEFKEKKLCKNPLRIE